MDSELQRRTAAACDLVADVASNFSEVCIRVTGASMLPALWPGDVITVCSWNADDLEPGEIVLYRREGKLRAHRIVSIDRDLLITKGDTLADHDPPVRKADVLGKVVSLIRNGRAIVPEQSASVRMCSAVLRRSDSCLRIMLRLRRLLRLLDDGGPSWLSARQLRTCR